jgi:hypothetical protein
LFEALGTKIGAKGGKLWVVADCSVELIIVVIARSLSGRGGRGGRRTLLLGVSGRDGREFQRRADEVLDSDDHGRNVIIVDIVVVLVNDG